MLISLTIFLPGTHFFHWRVKSWHRSSWFGSCLYPTPLKPFLSLAALALLPLLPPSLDSLPQTMQPWAVPSTWDCTRSCTASNEPLLKLQNWVHSWKVVRRFTCYILTEHLHHHLMWTHFYLSQTWGLDSSQSIAPFLQRKNISICVDHPSTAKLPTSIQLLPPIQDHLACH